MCQETGRQTDGFRRARFRASHGHQAGTDCRRTRNTRGTRANDQTTQGWKGRRSARLKGCAPVSPAPQCPGRERRPRAVTAVDNEGLGFRHGDAVGSSEQSRETDVHCTRDMSRRELGRRSPIEDSRCVAPIDPIQQSSRGDRPFGYAPRVERPQGPRVSWQGNRPQDFVDPRSLAPQYRRQSPLPGSPRPEGIARNRRNCSLISMPAGRVSPVASALGGAEAPVQGLLARCLHKPQETCRWAKEFPALKPLRRSPIQGLLWLGTGY
jgi:hypothetical protein